jgi:uncharacterized protein (DUF58 family)
MSGSLSPRVAGLLALAGAGAVAGLASGRPELAVLAAPLLVFVGVGLVLAELPHLAAEIKLDRDRLLEGDRARVMVAIRNDGSSSVELEAGLARSPMLAVEPHGPVTISLAAGGAATLEFTAVPRRWGAHAVGPLLARARDPLGVTVWSGRLGPGLVLRAFPREQRLRELVAPLRTQPFLGSHVARMRGEGIEFADVRPFAAGDRVRQVNWWATARRGGLYVTERHPEHASDVVLLLDTFAEARGGAGSTLDAAVRAAAGLARAHLARRDRVALVDFGGTLHWLEPAFGTVQLYRIVDVLIASEIAFSYAWRAVESIPRRVLPPTGLILAITPLLDERSIRLVTDLRRRGADVTVIEVSPLPRTDHGRKASDELAYRLWRLEREALRARLQALGIGVAAWREDDGLGAALEEVNRFRRSARQAVSA